MVIDVIVGKSIGNYYIEELIARGDMGSLYKGKHSVFTGRSPATIRVLPAHIAAKIDYDQFLRETQALIQLKHQNILSLVEAGRDGDIFYLISPYEPLKSLEERLQSQAQSPLPLEDALTILDQIARALRYAHEAGVIHRNLKPSNILLPTPNTIFVADFGLAVASDTTQTTTAPTRQIQLDTQATPPANPQMTTLIDEDESALSRTDSEISFYESFLLEFDSASEVEPELITEITPDDIPEPLARQSAADSEQVKIDAKEVIRTELPIDTDESFFSEIEISARTEPAIIAHTQTYAYLAPEQFNGMAHKKSDQYALACIAYELFTGHKPFNIPVDADRATWMQIHQYEAPILPSHYNSTLPDYIEQALLKALHKERRARYTNITSFMQALQHVVPSEMVEQPTKRKSRLVAFAKSWLTRDERTKYSYGDYQSIPWGLRIVAALCYLTGGIGGILLLLSRRGQQRFLRFHAWQATLYCLTLVIMWIISRILATRPGVTANLITVVGVMLICLLVVYLILALEKALKGLYHKTPLLGWIAELLTNINH